MLHAHTLTLLHTLEVERHNLVLYSSTATRIIVPLITISRKVFVLTIIFICVVSSPGMYSQPGSQYNATLEFYS